MTAVSLSMSLPANEESPPTPSLFGFDRQYDAPGWTIGADEAGRGCLAGPIVAAAVAFDYHNLSPGTEKVLATLSDSKKTTQRAREQLYPLIVAYATALSIYGASAYRIDKYGLHICNLTALEEASAALYAPGNICLVDGYGFRTNTIPHTAIVRGDAQSAAIAAASIIAKVSRDRFMHRMAQYYPEYGFDRHAGYGTRQHRQAIADYGLTPLHRHSFKIQLPPSTQA